MNPGYKVFCRTVQLGFRLALPLLPYREPRQLGAVADVPPLLQMLQISSVLLVTDPVLRGSGVTALLEAELEKNQIQCTVYDKTCPNPTVYHVEEALSLYHQGNCRSIIAFGGGASIDCAKAVAAGVAQPTDAPAQAASAFIRAIREMNCRMGIPSRLGGIRREDIPVMARHAHREANPLYPVPRLMDAAELEQIYYLVADWSEA